MFFLFFLFLSSCSQKYDYIDKVDAVVKKEIKIIQQMEDFQLCGYGGAMCDGIKTINITFSSYQKVDIAQARLMIVQSIEKIRNAVNAQDDLKDYLIPYPFPTKGIEVSIMFLEGLDYIKFGCVWLGTGGVSLVSQLDGILFYSSYNPRTKMLERYFNEPYEEALAIVNNELKNN
ncbi:MAG: hypothetical protein H0X29_00140 [Parachlamydiaceae bacterium]|nr:hypothetical protein [Parachlamydiaceae bacterium]